MGALRKALWMSAATMGVLLTMVVALNVRTGQVGEFGWRGLGHDFRVFYIAGTLARTGRASELYDMQRIWTLEQQLVAENRLVMGPGMGPWWNPPHAALMMAPISCLNYPAALAVWLGLNLAAFGLSAILLVKMFPRGTSWKTWALAPVIMAVSMPFVQAITTGQNTPVTLLLLCATVTLWRAGRSYWAGVVCGLLAYKPQHCALIGAVLVVNRGWPAALGLATTGLLTLGATLTAMPTALGDFLTRLPDNLRQFHENNHYMWQRQITCKGFWRLLIQGRQAGPTALSVTLLCIASWVALARLLAKAIWPVRKTARPTADSVDRLIAATIAATSLLMPFYYDYDLLLMAVPAVLSAGYWRQQSGAVEERWSWRVAAWGALFLSLYGQALMAGQLRFNVTAAVVAWIALLSIRDALVKSGALDRQTSELRSRLSSPLPPAAACPVG